MKNNMYTLEVLDEVQKLLEEELHYISKKVEKNISKREKKLVLQKNTPWGKLTNPKTRIGEFFDTYGDAVANVGIVINIVALFSLLIGGTKFVFAYGLNNYQLVKESQNWIKNVIQYGKYPFIATLPFICVSNIKFNVKDKFDKEEIKIARKIKNTQQRKKLLQDTLFTIQSYYRNELEINFFREFLENADLSGNRSLYNKELIILLSEAYKKPNRYNMEHLADYLRGSVSTEISSSNRAASSEFLNCEKVKQITRNY